MDISYLLFLQDFRNSIHDALTPFMQWVSSFAVSYLILFPVFMYWCTNKRKGLFPLCAMSVSVAVNAVIKLSACIYRPWIRDARIVPAGNAIQSATGYSFPSGHTTTATPLYGGMAMGFWKSKATHWLSGLCVLGILITGFSRNYLGVHTPQDVLVGLVVGIGSLLLAKWLFNYVEKHPEQENKFLLGGFLFCVISLIYITNKPYPADYVDGKLLVDPLKMMNDGYKDIGTLAAFCVARYVEKRWIRFQVPGFTLKGILWTLAGMALLAYGIKNLYAPFIGWFGPHWGRLVAQFILVFYIIALYPLVLKTFASPKSK